MTTQIDDIKTRAAQQARQDARRDPQVLNVQRYVEDRERALAALPAALGLGDDEQEIVGEAWDAYLRELREIEETRRRDRAEWCRVADGLFDWYVAEGDVTPRALHLEQERIIEELLLQAAEQLERLPAERQDGVRSETEARALMREDWQRLLSRMADRPPWQDLAEVLRAAGEGEEVHRAALAQAARAAARAVAYMHPAGKEALDGPGEAWYARCRLAERDNLRRGSAESKARRAAAASLLHMLRLWNGSGALSNAVSAWRCAAEAIAAAYDGPERRDRQATLRHEVLLALSLALRHAMGISKEEARSLAPPPPGARLTTETGEVGSYATAAAHAGEPQNPLRERVLSILLHRHTVAEQLEAIMALIPEAAA